MSGAHEHHPLLEAEPRRLRERPAAVDRSDAAAGTRRLRCVFYPDQAATRRCEGCDNYLSGAAVIKRYINHESVEICPCEVGARVLPLTPQERGLKPVSFEARLGSAFAYPLGGPGPVIIGLGTPFFVAMQLLTQLPYIGVGFGVIGVTYLLAYLNKIVFTTAMGDEDPPAWPEVGRWWESMVRPACFIVIAVAICGAPAAACALATGEFGAGFWFFAAIGSLFVPMAVACVAVNPIAGSLNPLTWIGHVLKVPAEYAAAVLTLDVAFGLHYISNVTFGQIPYIGLVFGIGIGFYFLMVDMRVLGLIFYANRKRLGWL
jgi:hypothetical protein